MNLCMTLIELVNILNKFLPILYYTNRDLLIIIFMLNRFRDGEKIATLHIQVSLRTPRMIAQPVSTSC